MLRKLLAIVFALGLLIPTANARRMCPILCGSPQKNVNYIATGDSITLGLGGVPAYPFVGLALQPGATPSTPGTNTPTQSPITGVGTVFLNDIAQSGISTITLDTNYAAGVGGAGPFFNAARKPNILSYMAGTNTSGSTDLSYGQKYWWIRDYIRKALNTGYNRIIIGTTTARNDNPTFSTGTLVPLNSAIVANYNSDIQADYLADFGGNVNFNPATPAVANNLTFYTADMLHPNVTGEAAMGAILAPALSSALAGPGSKVFASPTWSPFNNNGVGVNNGFDGAVALSGDLRTATVPTGNANYTIRSLPGARTGAIYVEVDVTSGGGIGIANDTFSYGNAALPGFDGGGNGIWWGNDGKIYFKSVGTLLTSTYASGDNLGMAIDFGAKLVWTRRCRSGSCQNWDNTVGCTPGNVGCAINFASVTLNGIADRYYPTGGVITGTDAVLSRFAASQLLNAIPSGFSTFGP